MYIYNVYFNVHFPVQRVVEVCIRLIVVCLCVYVAYDVLNITLWLMLYCRHKWIVQLLTQINTPLIDNKYDKPVFQVHMHSHMW